MVSSLRRRALASVQEQLPLDGIAGDAVQLRSGDVRAVLQAGSVNFALKSETEQEAILAGYRRFLNGLAYPLQILVRVVPTDVDGYLQGMRRERRGPGTEQLRRLALDHEAFVRRVARERTLLDRRFYIVVPSSEGSAVVRTAVWPWRRRADEERRASDLLAARRRLAFRCEEIAQGLAGFGVSARRLADAELAALWAATLNGHGGLARDRLLVTPAVIARRGEGSIA